jgi:hypothetical protein
MPNIPDERQEWDPVYTGIFVELIKLLPTDWNAASLILTAPPTGLGSGTAHSITSPENRPNVVLPGMSLFHFTRQLELKCMEKNWHWKRVLISVTKGNDGWAADLKYEY